MKRKIILVSGCGGFVGFHVSNYLAKLNYKIVGIDNLNNYYSVKLKKDRIQILKKNKNFDFFKVDLNDKKKLCKILNKYSFNNVIHLAAQAGVRHSFFYPQSYIKNNIIGTFNILDYFKNKNITNILLASTSSVYGKNKNKVIDENSDSNHPSQIYAASKRSTEIIAHAYSDLYNLPIICLRFFTLYGPWGRTDMALYKFCENILANKKIEVYNYGNHYRNFTYIDDVSKIISKLLSKKNLKNKSWYKDYEISSSYTNFKILNISSGIKITLKKFIKVIEKNLNKKSKKNYLPLQKGDVVGNNSSNNRIKKCINKNFKFTDVEKGIEKFVEWYKYYKGIK